MDKTVKIVTEHQQLIRELYNFVKETLGFPEDAKMSFIHSNKNAGDPLGRTAYYDPNEKRVTVFVTGRHIKDIMRSLSHELVHHAQNCRGDLQNANTNEGYAQEDEHMREMEKEAYLSGNMMFRDWEDKRKKQNG